MTPAETTETFNLIAKLWPKAAWPDSVQSEVARRVRGLPIDAEQARAALVNLRIEVKYATIAPGEVWAALQAAAGQARKARSGLDSDDAQDRADAEALAADPARLDRLGREWLALQGPRFAHWQPYWLVHPHAVLEWVWGRRFVAWARGRA